MAGIFVNSLPVSVCRVRVMGTAMRAVAEDSMNKKTHVISQKCVHIYQFSGIHVILGSRSGHELHLHPSTLPATERDTPEVCSGPVAETEGQRNGVL